MNKDLKVVLVVVALMFGYLARIVHANGEADHARDVQIAEGNGHMQVIEVLVIDALNEQRVANGKDKVTVRAAHERARKQIDELNEQEQ